MGTKWDLSARDLAWIRSLDSGGFGTVWKAFYRHGGVCAVKFILRTTPQNIETARAILEQVRDSGRIVIPMATGVSSSGHAIIMTECAPYGSLDSLLRKQPDLSVQRRALMALEIAEGMNYLHSKKPEILHLDLKPGNILVFHGYKVKIADLGLATVMGPDGKASYQSQNTPPYAAPEVLSSFNEAAQAEGGAAEQARKLTPKTDVFSYGMMLYQLFFKQQLVPFLSELESVRSINGQIQDIHILRLNDPTLRPTAVPDLIDTATPWGPPLWALIKDCWAHDPAARPLFPDIVTRLQRIIEALGTPPPEADPSDTAAAAAADRLIVRTWLTQRQQQQPPPPAAPVYVPPPMPVAPANLQQQQQPEGSQAGGAGGAGGAPVASPFAASPFECAPEGLSLPMFSSAGSNLLTGGEASMVWPSLEEMEQADIADTWTPPADINVPPEELAAVRWLKITLLLLKRAGRVQERYTAAELMRLVEGTRRGWGGEEVRPEVLYILQLTWTAVDWLVGAWGALVGEGGVVGREELEAALREGAVEGAVDLLDLQMILKAFGEGAEVRLGEVLETLAKQAAMEDMFADSTSFLEQQQARQTRLEQERAQRQIAAMEAQRKKDWTKQAAIMDYMMALKERLEREQRERGGAGWPDAIFMPKGELTEMERETVWFHMRTAWAFWDAVEEQWKAGLLPPEFFNIENPTRWLYRAQEYRLLLEPVDIARWYFTNKQADLRYRERNNCVEEGYHYDEGIVTEVDERSKKNRRRPGRYRVLQGVEFEALGSAQSSMEAARRFRARFGNRRWQDVAAEEQAGGAAGGGGGGGGGGAGGVGAVECPKCGTKVPVPGQGGV